MGETISYSGGDIPYVDRAVKITPDTPKPDSEAINEIKFLRAALEEREREIEDLGRDLIDCESQLTDALRRGETAEANIVGLEREVERLRKQTVSQGNEIDKCYREDEESRAEMRRLRDVLEDCRKLAYDALYDDQINPARYYSLKELRNMFVSALCEIEELAASEAREPREEELGHKPRGREAK